MIPDLGFSAYCCSPTRDSLCSEITLTNCTFFLISAHLTPFFKWYYPWYYIYNCGALKEVYMVTKKNFLFSCNLMGQMGRKGRRDHTYFMMWNSFWIYSLFSTVKPYARIKMFVGFILNTFSNSANWKYFWRDCTSTRLTLIENFVTSNCIWNRKYQHTSQVYASKAFDKQRHPPSRYYHVKKLYWLTDLIAAVFPLHSQSRLVGEFRSDRHVII